MWLLVWAWKHQGTKSPINNHGRSWKAIQGQDLNIKGQWHRNNRKVDFRAHRRRQDTQGEEVNMDKYWIAIYCRCHTTTGHSALQMTQEQSQRQSQQNTQHPKFYFNKTLQWQMYDTKYANREIMLKYGWFPVRNHKFWMNLWTQHRKLNSNYFSIATQLLPVYL